MPQRRLKQYSGRPVANLTMTPGLLKGRCPNICTIVIPEDFVFKYSVEHPILSFYFGVMCKGDRKFIGQP